MPFLTVAGITVDVRADGATERAPEFVRGEATRAFAGNLRATTVGDKRSWTFALARMTPAALAALRAAIAGGVFVTVDGDALGNIAVTAQVTLGETPYRKLTYPAGEFARVPTLTVVEV